MECTCCTEMFMVLWCWELATSKVSTSFVSCLSCISWACIGLEQLVFEKLSYKEYSDKHPEWRILEFHTVFCYPALALFPSLFISLNISDSVVWYRIPKRLYKGLEEENEWQIKHNSFVQEVIYCESWKKWTGFYQHRRTIVLSFKVWMQFFNLIFDTKIPV